jgi:two-component system CheB/CheR fusion protein
MNEQPITDTTRREVDAYYGQLFKKNTDAILSAFFDSLDEHIVVLNEEGRIVAANAAWNRFAHENDSPELAERSVGVNYLGACESPIGTEDTEAASRTLDGIREVLKGERNFFELEYPCHAPDVQRWFTMRALPLRTAQGGAVIVHTNVTTNRLLQQERDAQAERIRTLSLHLMFTEEKARQHLASELHDITSPNLAALRMNLDAFAMELPEAVSAEYETRLDDMRALLVDTSARIRELCENLRSPALDHSGLVKSIEFYAEKFFLRTRVPVKIDCLERNLKLKPEMELILFRIFKEAMTNIAKHANAKRVQVSLTLDATDFCLSIQDDGCGFDAKQARNSDSIGLLNMQELCEFSGGFFSLGVPAGGVGGVTVRCTFPRYLVCHHD